MKHKDIFVLTIVFWLLIFSGLILYKEFTLQTGEEVLLKTRPVDPRDLFRGDYVILRYEISTLDMDELHVENGDLNLNERVYVTLELEDGYGMPKKIYSSPPEEELFIKGTVRHVGNDILMIDYGIESYFVPEGKGRFIEMQSGDDLDVKIVIDRFGNAVIKDLLIKGEVVDFGSEQNFEET